MKKSTVGIVVIVIILVILGIVMFGGKSTPNNPIPATPNPYGTTTPSVPVTETTSVSQTLSEYHNAELGFSVKYPKAWEINRNDAGVSFVMPIDKTQVSTVNKLQADITTISGKCAFPPVTTIKERSTVKVKDLTFNMISMSNTVQGRTYFNRMYSLEKSNICYFFSFSSITLSPAEAKLTGSNVAQATNNNKAIINTADTAFTTMVKSFAFVAGPQGVDETKAPK